jgi:ATP-binding protein involved in chromosome partitioning
VRSIGVWSVKGGVGKTTVCAGLALALRDRGLRVGVLDLDVCGSNIPTALGLDERRAEVDTARQVLLPVREKGLEVFSVSMVLGKGALLWAGGGDAGLPGTGRYDLVAQILRDVAFSPDLDYLLMDIPPGSGDEALSLWDNLPDLWGILVVCQPTALALEDLRRTLEAVEAKRLPLLGAVVNMAYAPCPRCGERVVPWRDAADAEGFCRAAGVPLLGSLPMAQGRDALAPHFAALAEAVLTAQPQRPKREVGWALLKAFLRVALRER